MLMATLRATVSTESAPRCPWHVWGVVLLMFVLGSPAASLWAQDTGAGAFARIGVDAQGIALGNALGAHPDADVAALYNPALAHQATGQYLSLSAALMSFDRELQMASFNTPIGPTAGISAGVLRAGVNDIDGRDLDGNPTETLSTDEYALFLAFGNQFWERVAVGATLKFYIADLVDEVGTVQSLGIDLGATYTPRDGTRLGLSVSDLLAAYEWETDGVGGRSSTDSFPVRVRLSAAQALYDDTLLLLAEYEARFTDREQRRRIPQDPPVQPVDQVATSSFQFHESLGRIGVRYRMLDILDVRGGVDRIGDNGFNGWKPSAGFGLHQSVGTLDVRIDYTAVVEPYVTDLMNVLSIRIYL